MVTELRNGFPRTGLTELATADPEVWAKESHKIATKIAYQNGALCGTPKGQRSDCRESDECGGVADGVRQHC